MEGGGFWECKQCHSLPCSQPAWKNRQVIAGGPTSKQSRSYSFVVNLISWLLQYTFVISPQFFIIRFYVIFSILPCRNLRYSTAFLQFHFIFNFHFDFLQSWNFWKQKIQDWKAAHGIDKMSERAFFRQRKNAPAFLYIPQSLRGLRYFFIRHIPCQSP